MNRKSIKCIFKNKASNFLTDTTLCYDFKLWGLHKAVHVKQIVQCDTTVSFHFYGSQGKHIKEYRGFLRIVPTVFGTALKSLCKPSASMASMPTSLLKAENHPRKSYQLPESPATLSSICKMAVNHREWKHGPQEPRDEKELWHCSLLRLFSSVSFSYQLLLNNSLGFTVSCIPFLWLPWLSFWESLLI